MASPLFVLCKRQQLVEGRSILEGRVPRLSLEVRWWHVLWRIGGTRPSRIELPSTSCWRVYRDESSGHNTCVTYVPQRSAVRPHTLGLVGPWSVQHTAACVHPYTTGAGGSHMQGVIFVAQQSHGVLNHGERVQSEVDGVGNQVWLK